MKLLFAAALPIGLAGCATEALLPDVLPLQQSAKPHAEIRKPHYHPVLAGYEHRVPIDPEAWDGRLGAADPRSGPTSQKPTEAQ